MLLVELDSTLLAEWTDGMGDRRVLALGFCDLFYGLLVLGIGDFCTGRSPENDRDRAVGLVGELVAKQVAGRLAVVIVIRLLADAPGHNHYRERDHKPGSKDPHGVAGAKMTKTVEQGRQQDLLMTCGLYVLPRICISVGPPNGSIHTRNGAAHPLNGLVSGYRYQMSGFGFLLSSKSLEVSGRLKRSMVQSASTCARLRS
jgi:hypothetical protein